MFATDSFALAACKEAISLGLDKQLVPEGYDHNKGAPTIAPLNFFYLPFMHSECGKDQEESIKLFGSYTGLSLEFAEKHKVIIDRFGRYPHRNAVLGRESTPEEVEFLKLPGSGF